MKTSETTLRRTMTWASTLFGAVVIGLGLASMLSGWWLPGGMAVAAGWALVSE